MKIITIINTIVVLIIILIVDAYSFDDCANCGKLQITDYVDKYNFFEEILEVTPHDIDSRRIAVINPGTKEVLFNIYAHDDQLGNTTLDVDLTKFSNKLSLQILKSFEDVYKLAQIYPYLKLKTDNFKLNLYFGQEISAIDKDQFIATFLTGVDVKIKSTENQSIHLRTNVGESVDPETKSSSHYLASSFVVRF